MCFTVGDFLMGFVYNALYELSLPDTRVFNKVFDILWEVDFLRGICPVESELWYSLRIEWEGMRVGNVPMKSIQFIVGHSINKFFHCFDRNEIPGSVQHETSISKQRSVNDSSGGNDLNRISLFIKGNELTQSLQTVTSSKECISSNFSSYNISLGFNVNSVTLGRLKSQSLFWVIDDNLCLYKQVVHYETEFESFSKLKCNNNVLELEQRFLQ